MHQISHVIKSTTHFEATLVKSKLMSVNLFAEFKGFVRIAILVVPTACQLLFSSLWKS